MNNIAAYALRRLLLMIPMIIGITLVLFIVTRVIPVNPLAVILNEKSMDNPASVKAAEEKWGLNRPVAEQYWVYLKNVARGDLGVSFKTKNPVTQDILTFLPATIELAIMSFLFAITLGLPLGIIAALKSGKFMDHFSRVFALIGASMPPFWSGLLVLFIFYYKLKIAPAPGRLDPRLTPPDTITGMYLFDSLATGNMPVFWDALQHLILPSIILGWFTLALLARITRSSLIEVLQQDYIRTARAKGLKESAVVLKHALQNAMIPLVTVMGLAFAGLLTGAIMTETIFAWPGIGRYAVESSVNLDFPSLMGTTLVIAVLYMFMNLIVDITYGFIDPRIREA